MIPQSKILLRVNVVRFLRELKRRSLFHNTHQHHHMACTPWATDGATATASWTGTLLS
ncbi:hypothetical protein BOTBODRAFT_345968 [Botryobasidium botryosum FD-172 SS1]|uniref:Uncharacterized protein n=1 Tax=Botryobasidium botryosum (strain FD-172 SS1) TaxID=930990 RepID=A0A067MGB2_BOTB1|nr:hypothetical protein BOTBODRAFT_345968 [Botryobasidium botryosum FD-172 SS1]